MDAGRIRGFTLIELLMTISITTILTGVIVLMLKTSLDAYSFSQQEVLLEKALDDCLGEISGGGFESYGVKDPLEILDVTPTSITFVPVWVDDSQLLKPEHEQSDLLNKNPFILNRPFKAGSFLPITEISTIRQAQETKGQRWKTVPITLKPSQLKDPQKPDDQVFLKGPVDPSSKIRIIFHPDATNFPDCAMTIKWEDNKITRTYQGKTETIPKYNIPGVTLTGFNLQYFDNTNTQVEPKKELISDITAVRISLKVSLGDKTKGGTQTDKNGFTFINIRNTRTTGSGLIIRQGTRIKIPDPKHIRVFSLASVTGIKEGAIIELEARPKVGNIWKISIESGFDGKTPILKKYSIDYPSGTTVYAETINLTTDLPLNFMNLGRNSRYGYGFDKDGHHVVDLEGDVELVVTRMDVDGAALFIRP